MAEIVPDSDSMSLNEVLSLLQKNAEQMETMRKHLKETSRIIGDLSSQITGPQESGASSRDNK